MKVFCYFKEEIKTFILPIKAIMTNGSHEKDHFTLDLSLVGWFDEGKKNVNSLLQSNKLSLVLQCIFHAKYIFDKLKILID